MADVIRNRPYLSTEGSVSIHEEEQHIAVELLLNAGEVNRNQHEKLLAVSGG